MKRVTFYSSSGRSAMAGRRGEQRAAERADAGQAHATAPHATPPAETANSGPQSRRQGSRRRRVAFWSATAIALALASVWVTVNYALGPASRSMTPEEVGATVLEILKTTSLPSPAARAYAAIKPSVVRVSALRVANATGDVPDTSIGTGVVIIDRGVILTSLHVVAAAERVSVVFDDGTESDATVVVRQPERDIAVLTVSNLPDNLVAATLRSTQGLTPGERVVAVGFPFGIGPSVSAGVISGLGRQHRSKTGEHMIENLIQFDAAVNPGSSGGPLVTADGEVIGIVSSIINPNNSNVFAGVAFAVPIENAASVAGTSPF